jgi:hypothetical protein
MTRYIYLHQGTYYPTQDFNSLEIIFKMVTVMIKYHDPALARYLENYEI